MSCPGCRAPETPRSHGALDGLLDEANAEQAAQAARSCEVGSDQWRRVGNEEAEKRLLQAVLQATGQEVLEAEEEQVAAETTQEEQVAEQAQAQQQLQGQRPRWRKGTSQADDDEAVLKEFAEVAREEQKLAQQPAAAVGANESRSAARNRRQQAELTLLRAQVASGPVALSCPTSASPVVLSLAKSTKTFATCQACGAWRWHWRMGKDKDKLCKCGTEWSSEDIARARSLALSCKGVRQPVCWTPTRGQSIFI